MITIRTKRPVVFAGPSIQFVSADILKRLDLRPPVRRGDLELLLTEKKQPGAVIILDGIYGANLAVTPTECRWLLNENWQLIGACSMGALRASELWQQGMIGIGDVYNMFRLGYLRSDADVAVAYDQSYNEVTISIVQIRSLLSTLEKQNDITSVHSRKLLNKASLIPWFERHIDLLIDEWKQLGAGSMENNIIQIIKNPKCHPKIIDAGYLFNLFFSNRWL